MGLIDTGYYDWGGWPVQVDTDAKGLTQKCSALPSGAHCNTYPATSGYIFFPTSSPANQGRPGGKTGDQVYAQYAGNPQSSQPPQSPGETVSPPKTASDQQPAKPTGQPTNQPTGTGLSKTTQTWLWVGAAILAVAALKR